MMHRTKKELQETPAEKLKEVTARQEEQEKLLLATEKHVEVSFPASRSCGWCPS